MIRRLQAAGRRAAAGPGAVLAVLILPILGSIPGFARAQSPEIRAVRDYRAGHEREIVNELIEFVSLPNVASDIGNMRANARALARMLERRGVKTRLLESGGPPHVYGQLEVPGASRTVLFYCHFDGQPVDPERWVGHAPFTPVLRDGALGDGGRIIPLPERGRLDPDWRLYGRSASDDKAPIVALLAALDAFEATDHGPRSNLKFFFEADEEMGSPTLERIVREHDDLLSADLVVAADGPSDPSGRPTLFFGARGIATLEITVYGPLRPLHSGHYGNWSPNPAMRLSRLLASMKDPESGRVRVAGFYDDLVPLSAFERDALAEAPNDDREQMEAFAIAEPEMEGTRFELLNLPSLNVRGLRSGWVGEQARTIVPDVAIASIDMRLVRDIRPADQVERVIAHIAGRGYHVVRGGEPGPEVRRSHQRVARVVSSGGYPAFRTSMDLAISRALIRSIEVHTGRSSVRFPTIGGSVPLYLFRDVLGIPTVIVPIVNHDNNQHSPNENLRLGHLWSGIETLASVMLLR